ncbi:MAG: LapA family protein [Bacteroidota bacterium]
MTEKTQKRSRNYPALLVIGSVIILVLITFALQNAEQVEMRFFKLQGEVTKSLLIFACIFGGLIVGVLFSLPAIFKWRRRAKNAEKEKVNLKKELAEQPKVVNSAIEEIKDIKKPSA